MEFDQNEATGALMWIEHQRLSKALSEWLDNYHNPRPEIAGFKLKRKPKGRNMITKNCDFGIKLNRDSNRIEVNRPASDAEQNETT